MARSEGFRDGSRGFWTELSDDDEAHLKRAVELYGP